MSASERLRELKVGDGVSLYALEDALPEIVAVVENAQDLLAAEGLYEAQNGRQYEVVTLRAALAALEEKLSA